MKHQYKYLHITWGKKQVHSWKTTQIKKSLDLKIRSNFSQSPSFLVLVGTNKIVSNKLELALIFAFNPFLANVAILHLKTPEDETFFGVFRGY